MSTYIMRHKCRFCARRYGFLQRSEQGAAEDITKKTWSRGSPSVAPQQNSLSKAADANAVGKPCSTCTSGEMQFIHCLSPNLPIGGEVVPIGGGLASSPNYGRT
jgi:hypothetical protein